MLTSLNAFGGLSAAELLRLFDANSSPSSDSATSKNKSEAASGSNISGSSANDPAYTIQTILAEAQTATAAGVSASIGTVVAAYAAQSDGSRSLIGESVTMDASLLKGGESTNSSAGLGESATGVADVTSGQAWGESYISSISVTSSSSASGSVDDFQLAVSLDGYSVTVGFAVSGLGPIEAVPGEAAFTAGQGGVADYFQMMDRVGDESVGASFNVFGLNSAQAQELSDAFDAATSVLNYPGTGVDAGNPYTKDFAPGFSASFSDATYQYTQPTSPTSD